MKLRVVLTHAVLLMGAGVALKEENVPFWRLFGKETTGKTWCWYRSSQTLALLFIACLYSEAFLLRLLLGEVKLSPLLPIHGKECLHSGPSLTADEICFGNCVTQKWREKKRKHGYVSCLLWNVVLMVPWYSYNYLTGYAILGIIALSK